MNSDNTALVPVDEIVLSIFIMRGQLVLLFAASPDSSTEIFASVSAERLRVPHGSR